MLLELCSQVSRASTRCFPWALFCQIKMFSSPLCLFHEWVSGLISCECIFTKSPSTHVDYQVPLSCAKTFWNCVAGVHSTNRRTPLWPSATFPLLADWLKWLNWQLFAQLAEFQKVIKRMELDARRWLMKEEVTRWTWAAHSSGHIFRPPGVFHNFPP